MPSQLSISTGLTAAQLQGMVTALSDAGGGEIRIFAGVMPSTADAGVGGAVLLATVTGPSDDPLTLQVDGALLQKDPQEVWSGDYVAAGLPSFFRLCAADDTNASSTALPRLQGTVGRIDSDLNLTTTEAVIGQPATVKEFIYSFREASQG